MVIVVHLEPPATSVADRLEQDVPNPLSQSRGPLGRGTTPGRQWEQPPHGERASG